jgi:hypothetical protein
MTKTVTAGAHVVPASGPTGRLALLLAVIRREGGEWTTGRVKRLYRKRLPAHVLRVTMRRDLAALHADGHMVLHDSPHRRFYTYCTKGENA